MKIGDKEKEAVRQQLKFKGRSDKQTNMAIHIFEARMEEISTPEKNRNEYKRDKRYLEAARTKMKELSNALRMINPSYLYDLDDLTEAKINHEPKNNKTLTPSDEFYIKVNHDELDLILKQYQREIEQLQAKLDGMTKSELLMRELADLWMLFADMFKFTPIKADLIEFCSSILETDANTIKSRLDKLDIDIRGKGHEECDAKIMQIKHYYRKLSDTERQWAIKKIHSKTGLTEAKFLELIPYGDIYYPRNLKKFNQQLSDVITIIKEVLGPKLPIIRINWQHT